MHFTAPLRTLTKRFISRPTSSARLQSPTDDFSCLGWDGRPLRGQQQQQQQQQRDERQENWETEDYQKYYEKHKPSPLSKIEFADTRKLITRATDRAGDENKEILLVRETVDDALRRAEEMWWAAKVRGDPDSPQARAIARVLRERYNGEECEANIA